MKKRIAFLIVLLMILCLTLAGCAQRDNHAGATSDPTSESHEGGGVGTPDNSGTDPGGEPGGDDTNVSGSYTYNVSGTEFVCEHNIDDYIVEKDGELVFNLIALAKDIGWNYAGSPDTALRKQTVFTPEGMSYSPSTVQVKLEETDPYNTIYYIYAEGSSHSTQVYFVRGDLMSRDGESNLTYYVNSALNGKTISRDMVVILC